MKAFKVVWVDNTTNQEGEDYYLNPLDAAQRILRLKELGDVDYLLSTIEVFESNPNSSLEDIPF